MARLILGEDAVYGMDGHETRRNNNVLVVGASGTGKSRGIASPMIGQAEGSYVISDPKGYLYGRYAGHLKEHGYEVKLLDFSEPARSCRYNFLRYVKDPQDIVKAAAMLMPEGRTKADPFRDESSQLMLQALIAYLKEGCDESSRTLESLVSLVSACGRNADEGAGPADGLMAELARKNPDSMAAKVYGSVKVAADRTWASILISVNARLARFNAPELVRMTSGDDTDIVSAGHKKTAIFVVVSDTDRSRDVLADLFFTQAMDVLCRHADKECEGGSLPVPVQFIMDDFATNVRISGFPRMISNIRSRGISAVLMLQAESQLVAAYGEDARTIIANCDTYVYMGGNDIESARSVAERADVSLAGVLEMPVGMEWIFRRGEKPRYCRVIEPKDEPERGVQGEKASGHESAYVR